MRPPWELGRYFIVNELHFTGNAEVVPILAENTARVGILISGTSDAGRIFVSTLGTLDVKGIVITPGSDTKIDLQFHTHGPMVQRKWFAKSDGAFIVTVFETILTKDPKTEESGYTGNIELSM